MLHFIVLPSHKKSGLWPPAASNRPRLSGPGSLVAPQKCSNSLQRSISTVKGVHGPCCPVRLTEWSEAVYQLVLNKEDLALPNSFFLAAKLVPMYQVSTIYQVLPSRHSRLPSRHSRHLPSLASWCHVEPTPPNTPVSAKKESDQISKWSSITCLFIMIYNAIHTHPDFCSFHEAEIWERSRQTMPYHPWILISSDGMMKLHVSESNLSEPLRLALPHSNFTYNLLTTSKYLQVTISMFDKWPHWKPSDALETLDAFLT